MHTNRNHVIEFFGGPADGYVDQFSAPLQTAMVVRTDPHMRGKRLFSRLVQFVFRRRDPSQVVVAVYELTPQGNKLRYEYLRSCSTPGTVFDDFRVVAQNCGETVKPTSRTQ